jgi:NitT/TauT family transport system ATP-binding protein
MTSIRFSHISKSHLRTGAAERDRILNDFQLDVRPGELVALVGPSGVGKTTLLHIAAGLERPDAGTVEIDHGDRPARLGMVFQQPRLLEWLSVARNVELAMRAAGRRNPETAEILRSVGLEDYAQSFPLTLSGGQRQRVAIARAFAIEPDLLLLDEPFSALDELTARRLRLLVQELWLAKGTTGLLVTHNMLEAAFLADRVVVLSGRPARARQIVEIDLPRPRQPEDPRLFALHKKLLDHLI